MTGALTSILHMTSYATSAEMAKELGTFPRYAENEKRNAACNKESQKRQHIMLLPVNMKVFQFRHWELIKKFCPDVLLEAARHDSDKTLSLENTDSEMLR